MVVHCSYKKKKLFFFSLLLKYYIYIHVSRLSTLSKSHLLTLKLSNSHNSHLGQDHETEPQGVGLIGRYPIEQSVDFGICRHGIDEPQWRRYDCGFDGVQRQQQQQWWLLRLQCGWDSVQVGEIWERMEREVVRARRRCAFVLQDSRFRQDLDQFGERERSQSDRQGLNQVHEESQLEQQQQQPLQQLR